LLLAACGTVKPVAWTATEVEKTACDRSQGHVRRTAEPVTAPITFHEASALENTALITASRS
jgi:hypothetical protein